MKDMKIEDRMQRSKNNLYKVSNEKYMEMLMKNVSKDYKKVTEKVVEKVNAKDREIAENLEIDSVCFCQV